MIIRDILEVLRGSSSPVQLLLATWLGALVAFLPGFWDHPAMLVVYAAALLVLNANLGVAILAAGLFELVSLALMPISFRVGRWLIDGPGHEWMAAAVDTPVLALLDLEYYALSGGILVATLVGLLGGMLLVKSVASFRRRFAGLEEGSERYKKLVGKRSNRVLVWLLFGDGHGRTYAELVEGRFGRPIRLSGVVVVAVFAAVLLFAPDLISGPVLADVTREGLQSANGATVDLSSVSLDTRAGRLVLDDLAMADSSDLDSNLFRAARVEADGDMGELLKGRLTVDRVVVVDAANGDARGTPGVRIAGDGSEDETPIEDELPSDDGDWGTLDDYLAEAEVWEERLDQAQEWLERLGGGEDDDAPPDETLEERLEREIAEKGYARVSADHLLAETPALLVREIVAQGMRSSALPDERLDLSLENVSTDPALVSGAPRLRLRSQSGALDVAVALGGPARPAADNVLRFHWTGLSAEAVAAQLSGDLADALRGGTLDLSLDGGWAGGRIGHLDLPLNVTFHGVTLDIGGQPTPLDGLTLPFDLRGSLSDLRVDFDDEALTQALLDGTEARLRGELDAREQELRDRADAEEQRLRDELQQKQDEKLGELLGGGEAGDDPAAQLEQQAKEKAAEEVGGFLGGLLGGKKGGKQDDG